MRPTTIALFLTVSLAACGRGDGRGDGAAAAGGPGQAEAGSGAHPRPGAESAMPFGPKSAEARAQDSALRMTGSRHRKHLAADTSEAE
jgi:hypothetical protein